MPQPTPVETVAEPPIPSIYANSTRLMYSIYDLRLIFSENMMRGDGAFVQVDRVAVVMSPQHIKKLMKTVAAKLAEYEQKFGPIPEEAEADSEATAAATKDDASKDNTMAP